MGAHPPGGGGSDPIGTGRADDVAPADGKAPAAGNRYVPSAAWADIATGTTRPGGPYPAPAGGRRVELPTLVLLLLLPLLLLRLSELPEPPLLLAALPLPLLLILLELSLSLVPDTLPPLAAGLMLRLWPPVALGWSPPLQLPPLLPCHARAGSPPSNEPVDPAAAGGGWGKPSPPPSSALAGGYRPCRRRTVQACRCNCGERSLAVSSSPAPHSTAALHNGRCRQERRAPRSGSAERSRCG